MARVAQGRGAPTETPKSLAQSHVLGSSTDGKIYVLDRATGAIQSFFQGVGREANVVGLTTPVGEDFRAIVVSGSTLFAGSVGSWLIAYDLQQRRELWRIAAPRGSIGPFPIVVDGDTIYLMTFGGTLTAFSATQPKVLWDFGDLNTPFVASVAVSPTTLFASGLTGFWAIRR
jgi:outer membrane protein assembly factor BamB